MSQNQKIILKKSAVEDKTPTSEQLDYGEIAINYASGKEFISLKNADNQIVKITPPSEPLFRYDNDDKNGIVSVPKKGDINGCEAKGAYSFAVGFYAKANGRYSHAEGNTTTASGVYSHSEGNNTTASSNCTHAEGQYTNAAGICSHAEGLETVAEGYFSHTEGFYTKTLNRSEHASGQYNISTSNSSLFTIGNGQDESSRHNAFEVKNTGEIFIQKDKVNTSEMISLQDKLSEISEKQKTIETDLSGINELLNKIIGES